MFLLWANRLPKQRLANGLKKLGEAVAMDEPLVELETDKVTVEVPSPVVGKLSEIIAKEGDTVEVNALLELVEAGEAGVTNHFHLLRHLFQRLHLNRRSLLRAVLCFLHLQQQN